MENNTNLLGQLNISNYYIHILSKYEYLFGIQNSLAEGLDQYFKHSASFLYIYFRIAISTLFRRFQNMFMCTVLLSQRPNTNKRLIVYIDISCIWAKELVSKGTH